MTTMPLQNMSQAGFAFIDQYRTLAKDLEQQSCDGMLTFDQEVPQTRFPSDDLDLKSEVKVEKGEQENDVYNLLMIDNNLHNTVDNSVNSFLFSTPVTNNKSAFVDNQTICKNISSASSLYPSQPSLATSSHPAFSTVAQIPFTTTSNNFLNSKISTYITELGGSGCTVVSNSTGFQTDSGNGLSPPQQPSEGQEDSLEYIDLDKQPISFYDESDTFSSQLKSEFPLEEMVGFMTDVLQQDRESLKIPGEPLSWTFEHVERFVTWVCYRYDVQNLAPQFYQCDGQKLCQLSKECLIKMCGQLGESIYSELQLWKAAKELSVQESLNVTGSDLSSDLHLQNPYMERTQLNWTPCVSPNPSTCSGNFSSHSDHSDDDSIFGSQMSSTPASKYPGSNGYNRISGKVPTGRGHKQTIHLWQFLKELLLSNENNNDCIRWIDRKNGIFKIEDSKKVAQLWGLRKNRPAMNYDKLSRSVRQYYKKGIIKKTTQSKRLVYQFCAGYL